MAAGGGRSRTDVRRALPETLGKSWLVSSAASDTRSGEFNTLSSSNRDLALQSSRSGLYSGVGFAADTRSSSPVLSSSGYAIIWVDAAAQRRNSGRFLRLSLIDLTRWARILL